MASTHDQKHFMRFGLIAVATITCLSILGLASLVLSGPGELAFGSAENLAGGATHSTVYYHGSFARNGDTYDVRLSGRTLSLQNGGLREVRLEQFNGGWGGIIEHGTENIPVSVEGNVVTLHFPTEKVKVSLFPMYR